MSRSFQRLDGEGTTTRCERFQVSGVPDIYIPKGSDKGKSFTPALVIVTYIWPDKETELDRSTWDARVFGPRVLSGGKQGVQLCIEYEGWRNQQRPAWLLDLIREYGPDGWTYID